MNVMSHSVAFSASSKVWYLNEAALLIRIAELKSSLLFADSK